MVVKDRASLKMVLSRSDDEPDDSDVEDGDSRGSDCNVADKPATISLFPSSGSVFASLPTPHISFDGLNSGVPTRTTPTLTPTTLRNIEQTFIELQCPDNSGRHSNEARFVPPSVKPTAANSQYTCINLDTINNTHNDLLMLNGIAPMNVCTESANMYTTTAHNMNKSVTHWQHVSPQAPSSISQDCNSSDSGSSYGTMRPTPPVTPHRQPMMTPTTLDDAASAGDTMTSASPPLASFSQPTGTGRGRGGARRNVGGRKPQREANLSPEEEQRRQLRRERNKAAAARCRKRRVDHTNMLVEEVEGHESKKRELHAELQNMRLVKEELEMILSHHQKDGSLCKAAHLQTHRCNTTLRPPQLTNRNTPTPTDTKTSTYTTTNNNTVGLLSTAIKTEYSDMDYEYDDDDDSSSDTDRDMFPAPRSKRVMLTHASLPPVVLRPNRPNSLNVLPSAHKASAASLSDSLLPGMNSTPSSGLQFNFDSLMVGGTGLTPVAGPLLPTALHCGAHQHQQMRLCTSAGGLGVATTMADVLMGASAELNTPDVSHKMMLSL